MNINRAINIFILRHFIKICLFTLVVFGLQSCKTVNLRGQYVDDVTIEQMQGKALTKDEVTEIVGSPTIITDYANNSWYYVHRITYHRMWMYATVQNQRIVQLIFDQENKLQDIVLTENSHNDNISINNECTETFGNNNINSLQNFVKHIGKYNKSKNTKSRQRK
ncbi:MAG: outer membrane protein assembly factor BamE [Rickettsiaceae bacterium]